MAARFLTDSEYYPNGCGYPPVRIVRRTQKTIVVNNGTNEWRMRIKYDADGNEYAWYFDGKTNVCCGCDDFFVCTDEDCDEIFGVEEEL